MIVTGVLLSVGVSMIFARTYNQFIASLFIYAGCLYTTFMHKMVLDYVGLVAKHITFKERMVRKTTKKEYCLKDDFKL